MNASTRLSRLTMFKHILVATDGSELSEKAIAVAIELARALNAKLAAFNATPDRAHEAHVDGGNLDFSMQQSLAEIDTARAERILAAITPKAKAAGLEFSVIHEMATTPADGILAAAAKYGCDAIVMATRGRLGVSALLLGSETQKVLSHSTLPVLVVH